MGSVSRKTGANTGIGDEKIAPKSQTRLWQRRRKRKKKLADCGAPNEHASDNNILRQSQGRKWQHQTHQQTTKSLCSQQLKFTCTCTTTKLFSLFNSIEDDIITLSHSNTTNKAQDATIFNADNGNNGDLSNSTDALSTAPNNNNQQEHRDYSENNGKERRRKR